MNKTIKLKKAISDIGYKTNIRKGKGTALMSYSITIIIKNPPNMSLDQICSIKISVRNVAKKFIDRSYNINIRLKDDNGFNIHPCKEHVDIMPKDCADALRVYMDYYGLKHDKEKKMLNEKLYNLVCPSKNGKGNKSYLNIIDRDIRGALIENEIKNFDGITLIEIKNNKARELSVVEISKIVSPVTKTIVTWELTDQSSIVKV